MGWDGMRCDADYKETHMQLYVDFKIINAADYRLFKHGHQAK